MLKKIINLYFFLIYFLLISCINKNQSITLSNTKSIDKEELNTIKSNVSDTLIWQDELCTYYGEFDASKYTKEELKDTYKLWFTIDIYIDYNGYPVFNLEEKTKPIEELEKSYLDKKKQIENLKIINDSNWQNLRTLKLLKLKAYYNYKKTAFFAYQNPPLLASTNYNEKAKVYVEALISGDSIQMISAWKKLNEEQKAKNGYPEMVEKKFKKRLNSSSCLAYAKMELFTFGWSNNFEKIPHDYELKEQQFMQKNNFKNLFTITSMECDEP